MSERAGFRVLHRVGPQGRRNKGGSQGRHAAEPPLEVDLHGRRLLATNEVPGLVGTPARDLNLPDPVLQRPTKELPCSIGCSRGSATGRRVARRAVFAKALGARRNGRDAAAPRGHWPREPRRRAARNPGARRKTSQKVCNLARRRRSPQRRAKTATNNPSRRDSDRRSATGVTARTGVDRGLRLVDGRPSPGAAETEGRKRPAPIPAAPAEENHLIGPSAGARSGPSAARLGRSYTMGA